MLDLLCCAALAVPAAIPLRGSQQPAGTPFVPGTITYFGDALPARGVSFVDLDRDGRADLFNFASGRTWLNEPAAPGRRWVHLSHQDLTWPTVCHPGMPNCTPNYGAAFGDVDNDGLPDLATAPHDGNFPPGDPLRIHFHSGDWSAPASLWERRAEPRIRPAGVPLERPYETLCWGDLDGDGRIDLFAPAYAPWGNLLLRNRGGLGATWELSDVTAAAGYVNPAHCPGQLCRPEGAQLVDLDSDGDLDLYCNGTVYLNVSQRPGDVRALRLVGTASGIMHEQELDEGALFSDVDMDGDFDLLVNYRAHGADRVFLWRNRGDGTFHEYPAPPGRPVFEDSAGSEDSAALWGEGNGLAVADWDGDGDPDLIARGVFRENRLIESGRVRFRTSERPGDIGDHEVIPAFADWDRDGDLDAAMTNWEDRILFFENVTRSGEPPSGRPYLRVRPLRDSPAVPEGIANEFGAVVEVDVLDPGGGHRRRQFTSSSAGYLNQNEYPLTFGLELEPRVLDPLVDVAVDFPTLETAARRRIDKHVNPILGGLALSALTTDAQRQIDVFRSGRVVIDGTLYAPANPAAAERWTAARLVALGSSMATPSAVSGPHYVGIAFDTLGSTATLHVRELVVDGALDGGLDTCAAGSGNVFLWDVTAVPAIVAGSVITVATPAGNHRTRVAVEMLLAPGRRYRLLAKVRAERESAFTPSLAPGAIAVHGGLSFSGATPCDGALVAGATLRNDRLYMTFGYGL